MPRRSRPSAVRAKLMSATRHLRLRCYAPVLCTRRWVTKDRTLLPETDSSVMIGRRCLKQHPMTKVDTPQHRHSIICGSAASDSDRSRINNAMSMPAGQAHDVASMYSTRSGLWIEHQRQAEGGHVVCPDEGVYFNNLFVVDA